MPAGEHLTREHQSKAGKASYKARGVEGQAAAGTKHGVYPLKNKPLALWDDDNRALAEKIADELEDPVLARRHVQEYAGMGRVFIEVILTYTAEQKEAGIPLDEIPIFLKLPEFYRAYGKALKLAVELDKGVLAGAVRRAKNVTEELTVTDDD